MDSQATKILAILEKSGWELKNKENPESKSYWWVWEFWTLKRDDKNIVLTFLIDPQREKKKENVWAVAVGKKEPSNRLEAESENLLVLGRNWKDNLLDFIANINIKN